MQRPLWRWALGVLIFIIIGGGIIWRLHAHPTTLHITVYCQGVIVFPLAAHPTEGSTLPCTLANQLVTETPDALDMTVAFSVYRQVCVVAHQTISIPVMRPMTLSCNLPGSSQFSSDDDAAIHDELLGHCFFDATYIDYVGEPQHNSPCRLFVVGVTWG